MRFGCDSLPLWILAIFSSLSERTKRNGKTDILVEGLEPSKKRGGEKDSVTSQSSLSRKKKNDNNLQAILLLITNYYQ